MRRLGTVSIHSKLSSSSNTLLPHNSNFSPTLDKHLHSSPDIPSTGIVDSGATDIYLAADASIVNIDLSVPTVKVGTATGKTQQFTGTGDLNLPHLPSGFPVTGHIITGLRHTLIGVGPLCDAHCTVTFTHEAVIVKYIQGMPVLTGWREASGPRLWRMALQPGEANLPRMPHNATLATLAAYSTYDIPSVAALIRYFHAAAGYPVHSTWLKAISAGK